MTAYIIDNAEDAISHSAVSEAIKRGIVSINGMRVKYALHQERVEDFEDPEEWVRAVTIAWLIIERGYPANRLKIEANVPRRTPNDFADIVVYKHDACRVPYLVVENKAFRQSERDALQGIEQAFGNANSLRAPLALYDEGGISLFYDVENHPSTEREANRLGDRSALPHQYGDIPTFVYFAGASGDITPLPPAQLEARIRRAHSLIWAGGRRDPLTAFDEWSKLLLAKVADERTTPTGQPRKFQIGTNETTATVANRIHTLFRHACQADPSPTSALCSVSAAESRGTAGFLAPLSDVWC